MPRQVHPDDKVAAHRALKRLRALTGQGTAFPGAADAPGGGRGEGQGPNSSLRGRLQPSDAGSSSSLGSGRRGDGPPRAGLGSGPLGSGPLGSGPLGSGPLAPATAAQAEGGPPSAVPAAALRWMSAAGLSDASLAARGASPTSSWGRSVTRGPDKHRALFEAFEGMRNDGCDPCDEAEAAEHAAQAGAPRGSGSGSGSARQASGPPSARGGDDTASAGTQRRLARIASGVPAAGSVQSWPRRVAHGVEERPSIFGAFPEVAARLDRGGPRAGAGAAQALKPSLGSQAAPRVPPQLPPGPTPGSTQSWRRGVVAGAERRRSVLDVFGGLGGASSPRGDAPSARVPDPAGALSSTDTWPRAVAAAARPPLGAPGGGPGLGSRATEPSSGSLARPASAEPAAVGFYDRSDASASGTRAPGQGSGSSLSGLVLGDPGAAGPSDPAYGPEAHAAARAPSDARAGGANVALAPTAPASLAAGAAPTAQALTTARSAPDADGAVTSASERAGLLPDPGFHHHAGLRGGGMPASVQGLAPGLTLAAGPEQPAQGGGGRTSSERRPSLFDAFPEMRGGGGDRGSASEAPHDVENPRFPGPSALLEGALQGPRGAETLHPLSGPTPSEDPGGLPGVPAASPALQPDRQAPPRGQAGLPGDAAPQASQQASQLRTAGLAGGAPPAPRDAAGAGRAVEQGSQAAGAAAKAAVPLPRAPLFGGSAPESEETWAAGDTRTHTLAQVITTLPCRTMYWLFVSKRGHQEAHSAHLCLGVQCLERAWRALPARRFMRHSVSVLAARPSQVL